MTKRGRLYTLVLYKESQEHINAMELIEKNYKYAKILHNKDIKENGEPKKEHYHYVISFENARYLNSVARELNIKENELEIVGDKKKMLRYLTHIDNKEKAQYELNDIQTNMQKEVNDAYREQVNKETELKQLINLLNANKRIVTVLEISQILMMQGYIDFVYNKTNLIKIFVEDHNKFYSNLTLQKEQEELDEEENNKKWRKLDEELEEFMKQQGRL